MRQQVAGDLLNYKLIERLVVVERVDHVIAIREDVLVLIAVESDGVGETHFVEPGDGHALAEMRRGKQAIHLLLICVGGTIRFKRI